VQNTTLSFWFDENSRPICNEDMCQERFLLLIITSDLDLCILVSNLLSRLLVSKVVCSKLSAAFQFQVHQRHGTDGRTDGVQCFMPPLGRVAY